MKTPTMIFMLFLTASALADDEEYKLGPDSMRQEGVPVMPRAGLCRLCSSPDDKAGESRGLFVV
jgi:hypothetical protein